MGRITLDTSRDGLDGFPGDFEVVGRDHLGDVLAADAEGRIWVFRHGAGEWGERDLAFTTRDDLRTHLDSQDLLEPPPDDLDLAALRARKRVAQQFLRRRRKAPYSSLDAELALRELDEAIADLRHRASRTGRGLAACQGLGQRCEVALRAAGAGEGWICRAAAPDGSVLAVMGELQPPWTEERVRELLTPLLEGQTLKLFLRPQR